MRGGEAGAQMTMESRLGLVCRVRGKGGSRGALSSSGARTTPLRGRETNGERDAERREHVGVDALEREAEVPKSMSLFRSAPPCWR